MNCTFSGLISSNHPAQPVRRVYGQVPTPVALSMELVAGYKQPPTSGKQPKRARAYGVSALRSSASVAAWSSGAGHSKMTFWLPSFPTLSRRWMVFDSKTASSE